MVSQPSHTPSPTSLHDRPQLCYPPHMTKLENIQASIATLDSSEIAKLRAWLDDLNERLFDEKIERDAKAGKLDKLAAQALADHAAGLSRKL